MVSASGREKSGEWATSTMIGEVWATTVSGVSS
jgi:hypothetical protein